MSIQASLRERIRADIDSFPVFDTHEHLLPSHLAVFEHMHLIRFLSHSYARQDFISAGLRPDFWERFWGNSGLDPAQEKPAQDWQALRPFLRASRNTAYCRYLLAACRDLHAFAAPDLDEDNWMALSNQIEAAYRRPDWFGYVLGEKCRVKVALNDQTWGGVDAGYDSRFIRPVFRIDEFMVGDPTIKNMWGTSAAALAERWGVPIRDFESFMAALDEGFRRHQAGGARAIKVAAAYWRSLESQLVSRLEAERNFNQFIRGQYGADLGKVGDYVLGYAIEKAIAMGWPVQVHTGMLASNGSWLEYSKPTHLNRLFLQYPDARFDVFHGGYPYSEELGVLAKLFPNVYLDTCWLPLISPRAAADQLSKWLELVPSNKLLWGGDSRLVEQTYGSLLALKDVLAEVLADKVARGYFNIDLALEVAANVMWRNGAALFRWE